MNKPGISTYCLILIALAGSSLTSYAQADSTRQEELVYVRYVNEFPPPGKQDKKKGIFGRIGNFIFGAKPAVLVKPVAILADNPNKYWVIDQQSHTVALIEENKGITLKPKGNIPAPPSSLVDLCELPGKGLLVTDSRLNKVFLISDDGKKVRIFNDSLQLNQPTGIAYLPVKDQVWVLETGAHRIAVLDNRGRLLKTVGLRGGKAGEFNYPTHIWIDQDGRVYVVDSMNFRVQIFNSNGGWEAMFGQAGDASGYFARPKGVATDSHGNIYVVDALFHTVQIFDRQGRLLYNFGNQGHESGDFWLPTGIYIDSNDYIYIADSYNARVQVFQLINHE